MRQLTPIGLSLLLATAALGQQSSSHTLDLKAAIAAALRESPTVASARRAADVSAAQLHSARSAAGFDLYVRSDYGYINEPTYFGTVPILEKNTFTNALVLEKPVYSGGKIRAAIRQAKHGEAAASENAMAAGDAVTLRVAEAYYRAQMAEQAIDVAKESVNALQSSYDTSVKLEEAGLVTKADVLRAEVGLEGAKERLLAAENDYKTAVAGLKTAIGLNQSADIRLAQAPSEPIVLHLSKVQPRERHDVAGMKQAVAASEAGIRAAKGSSLPQVFLQADYQSITAGAYFPRQENTATVGLAVRLPIWDSGRTKSKVSEARSAHDEAVEDLRAVTQAAELETRAARLDLNSARARQQATATQVASAKESLRVLQSAYKEGVTPITDVLAAESALVSARYNRIATNYEVQIAQVRLLTSMGRADLLQ